MLETGNNISKLQWATWMENPSSLTLQDLENLQQLQSQFPWFSSANKFIAYLGKKENLSQFHKWNQQAALTSSNNFELFDLINQAVREIPKKPIPVKHLSSMSEEVIMTNEIKEPSNEVIHLADQVLESEDQISVITEEEWTIIPLVETPTISEVISPSKEITPEKVDNTDGSESSEVIDLGELGNDIMSKAISSSIELEVSERIEPAQLPLENHVNNDWGDDFLNFIAGSIGERIAPEEIQAVEKPVQEEKKVNIIDHFIKTEPQIARGRLMDFEIGNMAKESLEEDYNLVTETMAKLYVKQGKIEKARKAYKKLIELFPEKSIYFATQLKNLNKKNQ